MSDLTWVAAGVVATYGSLTVYAIALNRRLRRLQRPRSDERSRA